MIYGFYLNWYITIITIACDLAYGVMVPSIINASKVIKIWPLIMKQ